MSYPWTLRLRRQLESLPLKSLHPPKRTSYHNPNPLGIHTVHGLIPILPTSLQRLWIIPHPPVLQCHPRRGDGKVREPVVAPYILRVVKIIGGIEETLRNFGSDPTGVVGYVEALDVGDGGLPREARLEEGLVGYAAAGDYSEARYDHALGVWFWFHGVEGRLAFAAASNAPGGLLLLVVVLLMLLGRAERGIGGSTFGCGEGTGVTQ